MTSRQSGSRRRLTIYTRRCNGSLVRMDSNRDRTRSDLRFDHLHFHQDQVMQEIRCWYRCQALNLVVLGSIPSPAIRTRSIDGDALVL
jgi:hypothetical protein